MATNRLTGAVFALALALGACTGSGLPDQPPTGPDIKVSGALSLDERDIQASLSGEDLTVTMVLHSSVNVPIDVVAEVLIVSLDQQKVIQGKSKSFQVANASETLTLGLAAFDDARDATRQADYVIQYRVRSTQGVMSGARSLFVAVPKSQIVILGPKTYYAGETTRVKLFARDPVTGNAFADRDVVLRTVVGDATKDLPLKTDAFGAADATLTFPDSGSATVLALMATDGGGTDQAKQDVSVVRLRRVLVSTDKPLYQPGQVMHLRVLALKKPSLAPEAGADFTLEVMDGKGNKVFKQKGSCPTGASRRRTSSWRPRSTSAPTRSRRRSATR